MELTIKGKEVNVTLKLGAYLIYQDEFGNDFSLEKISDTSFIKLFYACYKNACNLQGIPCEVTCDEFFNEVSQDDYLKFYEDEILPSLKKNMEFQRKVAAQLA